LGDAQHDTGERSHPGDVDERSPEPDGCRAEQQAQTQAQRRRNDPGHEPEPASAGQTLPRTDDGTGDEPGHQSGGRAIDPTGDPTAGDAGDREGKESGCPDQPRPEECVSAARPVSHDVAILLAPDGTGSAAVARERE
jgi:hypothetical protein